MKKLHDMIENFEGCVQACEENINARIDEVIKELAKVKSAPASCWKVEAIYQGLSYTNQILMAAARELEVRLRQLQIVRMVEEIKK